MESCTVLDANATRIKKVLMVHNFYQIGGGEHTVFSNEVKLLRDHGHEVIEYTRSNNELSNSKLKLLLSPFSTIWSFKTYKEVSRIIREQRVDIVHCHNTFPLISPSVYYAAKNCDVPVVQTVHNFRFICPNGVLFRDSSTCEDCINNSLSCSLNHKCYRNSKLQTLIVVAMLRIHRYLKTYQIPRYIFLSDFNKSKFHKLLGEKLEKEFIKPNFEYISFPQKCEERDNSYIFVGRLDKNKGIDFLVDNWDIKKDLYIFGNGILEDYVTKACKTNKRLHYMGFQPQEIIWEYLGRATAMLFPTDLYEGFPMTIIESFALGIPVICSDIGNGADIVKKEKAGVVYDRRNKEALFNAISETEMNFDMYSQNAKKAYETKFTPEANYRQILSIYEAIKNE